MHKLIGAWNKLSDSRRSIAILIIIITAAALCQLYQINRDFVGYWEYDATQSHLLASNVAKYGLSAKMGPVCNINPLNDNFTYYLHHPFLATYIFALFFKIVGSSILTGRLIAMIFFGLATASLYLLVSRLWSRSIALWSCFFFAFFPTSQYFFKFVGGGSLLMICAFAFVYYYDQWQKNNDPGCFRLMIAAYLLGCAIDWETIFLAPVAFVHFRYIIKDPRPKIWVLPIMGGLFVALYLAVNYLLTGSLTGHQPQWPANIPSSQLMAGNLGFLTQMMLRMDFSLLFQPAYYAAISSHLLNSFTWPAIFLSVFFIFNFRSFKYFSQPTVYVLFLASLYLGYGLIHPQTLVGHITLTPYLSASLAIACALVLVRTPRLFQAIFALIFLLCSLFSTWYFYSMDDTWRHNITFGRILPIVSEPTDGIMLAEPFFKPYIEYRGERKVLYDADNLQRIKYAIKTGKIKYFITPHHEYKRYCIDRFPALFLPDDYADYVNVLFDVQTKGPAKPGRNRDIAFANNLKLIFFSAKRLPDGYLLLEYGWEKTGPVGKQDMVFVHLECANQPTIGQDHFIQRGITDLSGPDQRLIKESYIILLPEYARNKKLSVHLGLYPAGTNTRISVLNLPARDNRVYLGKI